MNLDREQTESVTDLQNETVLDYRKNTSKRADASSERQVYRQSTDSAFARFFWFFASAAFVLCVWKAGPSILESYQYSIVKGTIRAEYDNAVEQLASDPLSNVSDAFELVAQKIRPSVVSVRAIKPGTKNSRRGRFIENGQGSGVIMSEQGHILTNEHVIRDASNIEITLFDRRVYAAKLVGSADEYNDLAVLKIDAPSLIPAQWGDSDELEVGSIVWAIGSPFGLDQTVTSGIISAKNRYDRNSPYQELLQTDAAVNPGNSGGPLVDSKGRVVGINTSIYGDKFQGISFAVPSVQAKFVYEETLEKGYVARGMLGAQPFAVFQDDAAKLGLPDINGALLVSISEDPDSPALIAGLKENDVIRSWNGQFVDDYNKLYRFVSMTEPFSTAEVEFIRDGKNEVVEVQVGSRRIFEERQQMMRSQIRSRSR